MTVLSRGALEHGPLAAGARGTGVVLLWAAFAFGLAGCSPPGHCATGVSYIGDMSVPAPRNRVIGDWGYMLALTRHGDILDGTDCRHVLPGIAMYPDTHGEYIWQVFTSIDLPSLGRAARAELAAAPRLFPILSPLVGAWFWVESPNDAGLLMGVRAGVGARLPGSDQIPVLTLEYGFVGLLDVLDKESAEMETVTLALHWPL